MNEQEIVLALLWGAPVLRLAWSFLDWAVGEYVESRQRWESRISDPEYRAEGVTPIDVWAINRKYGTQYQWNPYTCEYTDGRMFTA